MMFLRARLVAYSLMLAGSASVCAAQSVTENRKLTASDAAAGDQFGRAVAISGTTAIVGVDLDDDAGTNSGSAYLFDTTTGLQIAKLTASDGAAQDIFGWAVAISGTTAIVGTPRGDGAVFDTGSAYLFDISNPDMPVQIAKLTASDGAAQDNFGVSVAISGTIAIVGANADDDAGSASGSAYLFDTTTGLQIAKLTASDAAANDQFGWAVAISGTTAMVGADLNDDAGSNSGSVYLFDTTTGLQIAKLTASDAAAGDQFGFSVAISGTTAMVGTLGDDAGAFDAGTAYLFDISTPATPVHIATLTASDAAAQDQLGSSVAISGTTAIVGASLDDHVADNAGSAYIFLLCRPDMNNDGLLDFFDLSSFLTAFSQQSVAADFNNDARWDFFDVSRFVIDFSRGCP